jgi:PII-like signaling protein
VNDDCLKLTTYFGERDRTGDGLLADELMSIYGGNRIAASIILRGAEGFGRLHHLHTDRLLSSSEDLPVVSIAVDERSRIEPMLEVLLRIKRRGLITLERARLLSGEIERLQLPEELGEATKLTIYFGRQDHVYGSPAYVGLCDLMYRRGLTGASVLLGVDGTRAGRRSRAKLFARNADVPMMLIAIGPGVKIAAVLPELAGLLHEPLMTLERVRVCKRDGELISEPHELPSSDEHGLAMWQKLMIYTSHTAAGEHGRPLHLEIVHRLQHETEAAGATVLRGLWGFHGDHAPHGDKLFQIKRHVPVCTIVIDRPERIAHSFQIIDEITSKHGLVTSEMVPAAQAMSESETKGGLRLARHRF